MARLGGQAVSANSYNFQLQMPDNTRRQPAYGKEPALSYTNLNPDDCVRGWITYEVPAGVRPVYIVFDTGGSPSSGAQQLKWKL